MQTQPEQSHSYRGTVVPEENPAEKAPVRVLTILVIFLTAAGPKTCSFLNIFLVFTYYQIFLFQLNLALLIHIWFSYIVAERSMQEVGND